MKIEKWESEIIETDKAGLKTRLVVGLDLKKEAPCVKWHNHYIDIFTGKMDHKKTFYRITNVDWNTRLKIEDDMKNKYLDDITRNGLAIIPENEQAKKQLLTAKHALNPQEIKNKTLTQNMTCYQTIIDKTIYREEQNKTEKIIKYNQLPPNRQQEINQIYDRHKKSVENKYANDARDTSISYPDILRGAEQYDYIIPCFYVEENGIIQHFGFSRYYRIPYERSIGDHIPPEINCDTIDFTDAVFGRKEDWASRIFFEDLYLENKTQGKYEQEAYHKILSTPNPTSFQLYLEKQGNNAAHWDDQTNIRGYKMYWHKKMPWQETEADKQNDKLTKKITPLAAGNQFKGRIRFENLDAQELGALCVVFSLGGKPNICYKLGMGKPIGMGTVQIKAQLQIRNNNYYNQLFDNNGFAQCTEEKSIASFANIYYNYLKKQMPQHLPQYKQQLDELEMIMSTQHTEQQDWNTRTKYMETAAKTIKNPNQDPKLEKENNRIKNEKKLMNKRIPLPSISEVVRGKK